MQNPQTRQAGLALWGQLRQGSQQAAQQLFEIQKLMEARQYEQWRTQDERGYQSGVRQEGYQRDDQKDARDRGRVVGDRQELWKREDLKLTDQRDYDAKLTAAKNQRDDEIRKGTWDNEKEVALTAYTRELDKLALSQGFTAEQNELSRNAPTGDMKEYNFYAQREIAAGRTPEEPTTWWRNNRKSGAPTTNVNNLPAEAGDDEFTKKSAGYQADRWNKYVEASDAARVRLGDINELREAGRRIGSQGAAVTLKALVGPYAEALGIQVDGLSDIQAADSIIKRLAPNMRATNSGGTSDIEYKGFVAAIGPLSNNPEARERILDTFEAASRNELALGDIATRLQSKEITRSEAEKERNALPDPMTAFREFRKANPDLFAKAVIEGRGQGNPTGGNPPPASSPEQVPAPVQAAPSAPPAGRSSSGRGRQTGAAAPPAQAQQQATIPAQAVDYLRSNPALKADFDAKYGQGAADRVLGSR